MSSDETYFDECPRCKKTTLHSCFTCCECRYYHINQCADESLDKEGGD
jgi:hypothetical protein